VLQRAISASSLSTASNRLAIHCLDVGQPVVAQSAVEEELLARAFGVPLNDG
jgi:hypothetical protein